MTDMKIDDGATSKSEDETARYNTLGAEDGRDCG
jgi:hypothetical protein